MLGVVALATLSVATPLAAWIHEARLGSSSSLWRGLVYVLWNRRQTYAAYCVHLGFVCVAMGVAGSSLGTQRTELTLDEGSTLNWGGRQIHYLRLEQRSLPDKLVAEAVLRVARDGQGPVELRPARHLHLLQDDWTSEVAIDSTWRGDFYAVLHAGLGDGRVVLTFVDNPMIGWIWGGGILASAAAVVALLPAPRRKTANQDVVDYRTDTQTSTEHSETRASAA
jgi:cytochrome c-type biogenesis protein CcmF